MESLEADSLSQEFEKWKAEGTSGESWAERQGRLWDDLIDKYFALGWVLIPCAHREKWPVKGANWRTMRFEIDYIKRHVRAGKCEHCGGMTKGGNIALNAGDSELVICDYDSKMIPRVLRDKIGSLPVITTPKGFAFITRAPVDQIYADRMFAAFEEFDVPRAEGMYEVIPLSETCSKDSKGAHKKLARDHIHDFRVRRWIGGADSLSLNIPEFKDFVRSIL